MFGKRFWVYCVMGNYGSGKTSGTFLDLLSYPKEKTLIIGNIPYSFVDLMYDTIEELDTILNSIVNYCKITNRDIKKYYLERFKYKDIVLVVDEAHLYFDARKWKQYSDMLDVILSQCRKRNIKCFFMSQRLKRVDLNIRRLSDFVVRYSRTWIPILPNSQSVERIVYSNEWDLADIQWDEAKTYIMNSEKVKDSMEASILEKSSFKPLKSIFGRFPYKDKRWELEKEAYNSLYIAGLDSKYCNENDPFLKKVLVDPQYRPIPKNAYEKYIPTFYSLYKKINVRSNSIQTRTWGGFTAGSLKSDTESSTAWTSDNLRPRYNMKNI